MAIPILNGLPASFESGDTVYFRESFSDFPAGTWTATLYLSLLGTAKANVAATVEGFNHLFALTSAITDPLPSGLYDYVIKCTLGDEKRSVKSGTVEVLADLSENHSASQDQQALVAAYSTRTRILSGPNVSVGFNGQTFSRQNMLDLEEIITRLESKVKAARDRAAALRGAPVSRMIRPVIV